MLTRCPWHCQTFLPLKIVKYCVHACEMDGCIGWLNGWVDGWMDRWMYGWVDGCINGGRELWGIVRWLMRRFFISNEARKKSGEKRQRNFCIRGVAARSMESHPSRPQTQQEEVQMNLRTRDRSAVGKMRLQCPWDPEGGGQQWEEGDTGQWSSLNSCPDFRDHIKMLE